ncbi:MAG: nitroreductase [Verrucomicrobia bacterium Tous-C9LFEB]|nr:MAG: nitroreductase [Verrucomicrobia bacterium Tous-C9LFEB]
MSTTPELTVAQSILQRRSCKRFKPDAIPAEVLERVIELTLHAPSSFNMQPWRLIVIDDAAQKEALAKVAWNQPQITTAPVVLVFAVSLRGWEQTFESVIKIASELGAWPEKFVTMARGAVPGFQNALGAKEREYAVKDALIAATHTALAAESLGLSSCFMNGWDESGVKEIIGAKDNPDIAIALVMPIGYSLDLPKFAGRLPREVTVFKGTLSK